MPEDAVDNPAFARVFDRFFGRDKWRGVEGTAAALPVEDGSADAVVVAGVLYRVAPRILGVARTAEA